MADWRERLIDGAAPRLPLTAPLFVNLWACRRKGRIAWQADCFGVLDDAAADAAAPGIDSYAGTLLLAPDRPPAVLDLAPLGDHLRREQAAAEEAEERASRGLARGAGRPVL